MVFSSTVFLFLFLPAVCVCYFAIPGRFRAARNAVLLVFIMIISTDMGKKTEPKYESLLANSAALSVFEIESAR